MRKEDSVCQEAPTSILCQWSVLEESLILLFASLSRALGIHWLVKKVDDLIRG